LEPSLSAPTAIPSDSRPQAAPRSALPTRLLNRNFVLLWQGQAISQLGTQVCYVAIVLILKQAADSASLIGLVMMISALPSLVFGPIAGALADATSRKGILIVTDVLRGGAVLGIAAVLYVAPHDTDLVVSAMMAAGVGVSIAGAFFGPAISAAIPDIVPRQKTFRANSLRQITGQLAMIAGRGLGGLLFALVGAPLLVLLNGLSFLVSAAAESFIEIPRTTPHDHAAERKTRRPFFRSIVEGLRYVWRRPGLKSLFLFSAMFNFLTVPLIVVLPFYVEDHLKLPSQWYGYLLAVFGAGSLLGTLSAGFVPLPGKLRAALMLLFSVVTSSAVASLAYTLDPQVAVGIAFGIGTLAAFNGMNVATIVQISTPSEMRGRTTALLNTLSGSAAPLGMGLAGIVFDALGRSVPLFFGGCGAGLVFLSLLVALNTNFRRFLAYE